MAIDSVCGMNVDSSNPAATTQYQGKTYYFCNSACQAEFEKAPENYLGTSENQSGSEACPLPEAEAQHNNERTSDPDRRPDSGKSAKVSLSLSGMSCASCARTIEKALNKQTGVIEALVNFPAAQARVVYDPESLSTAELASAVSGAR